MKEVVSIERDGAAAARAALERCMADGGVAVFPADGLYGLCCDPSDAKAIERIHALKGRPQRRPSAVMFFSPLAMRELIATVGSGTREALAALLPGPVTVVVKNRARLYPLACRDDPERLGVRLIEGPLARSQCAIFQTSANRSGEPPPSRFDDLDRAILGGTDLAIDGGVLGGSASTVVDLSALEDGGGWRILREGALDGDAVARRMERVLGTRDGGGGAR